MHPKISKEITHAKYYLQRNPVVVVDPIVSLFSLLSYSFFLQIQVNTKVLQAFSKNALSVHEYEIKRVCHERGKN